MAVELPEPIGEIVGRRLTPEGTREFFGYFAEDYTPDKKLRVYTADQMREHEARVRAEAMEEAAMECDRLTHALDHAGVSYHRPASADRCARAIRSLIDKGSEAGNV